MSGAFKIVGANPEGGPLALSRDARRDWRPDQNAVYRMTDRAYIGLPRGQKDVLRLAAQRLSEIEGRKVSMSEVGKRLLAAAGIVPTDEDAREGARLAAEAERRRNARAKRKH